LTGQEGLYPVCKPPGLTSHDVVALLRRVLGERHVGHAGTLDPAAAGVLLVLAGRAAARLSEYLLDLPKVYVAEVRFGRSTDTQDYTGRVTGGSEGAAERLTPGEVEAALPGFTGRVMQLPPMVSAVRVGGERLYRLAQAGREVERRPRPVEIYGLDLLDFETAPRPTARLRVTCSRGTYVRTLAHDLGVALGVGAHLGFLVREAVGPFTVDRSATIEELVRAAESGTLGEVRVSLAGAVAHLPAVHPRGSDLERLLCGNAVPWRGSAPGGGGADIPAVRVLSREGELMAVAALRAGFLRPKKVFAPCDGGGED